MKRAAMVCCCSTLLLSPATLTRALLSHRPTPSLLRSRVLASVTTSRMSISDQPFASPRPTTEETKAEWSSLGLLPEVQAAIDALGFDTPSSIQRIAIPQITSGGNMVVAAATGAGKTLAYLLPVINALKSQEQVSEDVVRKPGRPRALILVPTRELAAQVLGVTKQVAHQAKVSSCGIFGGEDYGKQKRELSACQDVVVGSPGRLLKHRDQRTLHLSQVSAQTSASCRS